MKKSQKRGFVYSIYFMRYAALFAVLLQFTTTASYAKATSQNILDNTISISLKNVTLRQSLTILSEKANCEFIYSPSLLPADKKVSVNYENRKLRNILDDLLKPYYVIYESSDSYIFIKEKPKSTGTSANKPQGTVTGKVTDEKGQPLPGVSVSVKGTTTGSISDAQGNYSVTVSDENGILVFSFIGYNTEEVPVASKTVINVTMVPNIQSLENVVVVGYSSIKKRDLTGSVEQVDGKALENRSVSNVTQGLQGVIPNLNIIPQDGKPIQSPPFNIRGTTSIGQGGNALVLVDGVEGDPSRLNPNDIASVTVLKDAASCAIYGARGAFGVVLFTTKKANKERTNITYSVNHAFRSPTTVPDLVTDGYQFAKLFNEAWSAWNDYSQTPQNINKTVKFSQDYLAELERHSKDPSLPQVEVNSNGEYVYYANTDWYKELYKKHTTSTEHNISFSGGNDKSDFYVSGRAYTQDGLFRYNSDDYKMYNLRAKGSLQLTSWLDATNNVDYSSIKYHNPLNVGEGGSIWRNISDEGHNMAPMFNPDGTLTYSAAYTVGDFVYGKNGIDMNRTVIRNTTSLSSHFFENKLRIKGDFTFQNTDNDENRRRVQVPYSRKPGVIEYVGTNTNDLQVLQRNTKYMATNIYSEYENFFGNHYVKALVGFNYEQSTYKRLEIVRNGLVSPDATDLNLALGQSITTSGGYDQWAVMGGFYRLNYGFKDKYLVEFNGRYDGSSKFPSSQRYAFFPSVSAGWRVSKEAFWTVPERIISDLKIRASYGSLGNGAIDSYSFQEKFNIKQSQRVLNGVKPQQTSQPTILPDGLTWETANTQNLGINLGLLSNHLNVTADAYIRKTTNMFTVGMTLPAVFGTNTPIVDIDVPKGNYADMRTTGWEASIAWNDQFKVRNKPFNYNIRFVIADYTSKVTKYNNPKKRLTDYYAGQTVGEIWGFVTDGFFKSDEDIKNSAAQTLYKASTSGKTLPGDIKFKNLNEDNVINNGDNTVDNPGDRKVIGNATPRYTYGVNLGADWNGFFFSAFFQGVAKQDWYPGTEAALFWGPYNRPYNRIPKYQLDQIWSEENPNTYFPRLRGYVAQNGSGELTQTQTKYLQNVAYVRLKNLQIGYNFPQELIKRAHMSNARIYLSAENIWTWSPLYKLTRDIDVESINGSDRVLTDGKTGNGNNYPILKSMSMGLSVTF
ncbi:SusC/RagA family TonB-linked outer membrane protein [Xanthocytophaga flava]|uniref:SusC/RagA family TonB-linked outer membrane protein n=1 Tax=Xanthocytophaga flava TaxID=3048013 RepID=UPI0028D313C9|nr:TonB-dependent receptor [Xanthocytophaga flavus]MDJ1469643.1 TonB-dependent receptor [Xanthocytophaga flavus]